MHFRRPLFAVLMVSTMSFASAAAADPACTLIVRSDTGDVVVEEGDCDTRATPASTFKLPLAVIGFDTRKLTSPEAPAIAFDPEKHMAWLDAWKTTTTPRSWLRDSVVWYSWEITRPVGMEGMQTYLDRFDYGNRDMSGTANKEGDGEGNGLTHAWLSSSLEISPREQATFISKLLMRSLPATVWSQSLADETTASYEFGDGKTAKGKTGNGFARDADGEIDRDRQIGWFVGWTHDWPRGTDVPDDTPLVFVRLIRDDVPRDGYASLHARDTLLADLPGYLKAAD